MTGTAAHHAREEAYCPGLSAFFLRFGVLAALIGVAIGVGMGISEDFRLVAVHAHLNLLGWVSMLLYGLFYHLAPRSADGCLAVAHALCAVTGLGVFLASLALKLSTPSWAHAADIGLAAGSALVFTGMALFAVIVFQATEAGRWSAPTQGRETYAHLKRDGLPGRRI